jgi:LytS/YehU family sensor histidine kinase
MLARLGDFPRHTLSSNWPWVDVATELTGLEAYLAVQQARFSDRLSIFIDASGGTSAFLDLPLRREAGPELPEAAPA